MNKELIPIFDQFEEITSFEPEEDEFEYFTDDLDQDLSDASDEKTVLD